MMILFAFRAPRTIDLDDDLSRVVWHRQQEIQQRLRLLEIESAIQGQHSIVDRRTRPRESC